MITEFKNELNDLLTEVEILRDRFERLRVLTCEVNIHDGEEVGRMRGHLDDLITHIDEFFWNDMEVAQ